jgi:hypothetical protein
MCFKVLMGGATSGADLFTLYTCFSLIAPKDLIVASELGNAMTIISMGGASYDQETNLPGIGAEH